MREQNLFDGRLSVLFEKCDGGSLRRPTELRRVVTQDNHCSQSCGVVSLLVSNTKTLVREVRFRGTTIPAESSALRYNRTRGMAAHCFDNIFSLTIQSLLIPL